MSHDIDLVTYRFLRRYRFLGDYPVGTYHHDRMRLSIATMRAYHAIRPTMRILAMMVARP